MASISYWFLSPSLMMALAGKLRGWDRTVSTPSVDWRKVIVDVVLPGKNEEKAIALALSSLAQQDFPYRNVVVFDDGSTDRTSQVVERYRQLSGREIQLVRREKSIGKTPSLREYCQQTDADAMVILDADTVLVSPNYISRLIEELYKNAGVSAACGEVMPLTQRRRNQIATADANVRAIQSEFSLPTPAKEGFWLRFLTTLTILYRAPMYILLQRTLYDGTLKLFGGQLNPVGCAVAYRVNRLNECFTYAKPRVGDNLSMSEDIYIGHFFNWKGYRSMQVIGVQCESTEPPITRLPRQLFLWSSAFLQSTFYFIDLPLSPLRHIKRLFMKSGKTEQQMEGEGSRKVKEQYRAAWGEEVTRRSGRPVGWLELVSLLEKLTYPLILTYLFVFNPEAFCITIGVEAVLCMLLIMMTADSGSRFKYAAMIVPATPVRLLGLGVDVIASVRCLADLASGNRNWRK
jgi:glycosyltransferase involved in cell wall biosynthesis